MWPYGVVEARSTCEREAQVQFTADAEFQYRQRTKATNPEKREEDGADKDNAFPRLSGHPP